MQVKKTKELNSRKDSPQAKKTRGLNPMKDTKLSDVTFKFLQNRAISLMLLVLLIVIVMSIVFPGKFATSANIKSVILNMSTDAIASIGMMILLISGVFDLSIGSMLAVSGALVCNFMAYEHINMWVAIVLTLAICGLLGLFNGVIIAVVGVNPMITTLATMQILRGFAILLAGSGISNVPDSFLKIASINFLGIQAPIWYTLIIAVIFSILVQKTKYFRRYYYIGGNDKAASLSGINVKKMRIISFLFSALFAAVAGIIYTSRLGAAVSSTGTNLEMRAITASILGGASLFGGTGGVVGVILGTLFLGLIQNLMVIAQISVYWQSIITGFILLIAVISDILITKRQSFKA